MRNGINIKKAGQSTDYDENMINEIIKCKKDIIYFAEKYYTIITIDEGKVKIKLWDWQKKVLKAFVEPPDERNNAILKISRQAGKCFFHDSVIKVRNKKTGDILEMSIGDFYKKIINDNGDN